jgi:hypothetical protein
VSLRDGYAGPFDPDLGLADCSRGLLAHLGREFLLSGHLQDRVGMPLVMRHAGPDAYVTFAIEEWAAASPIYSKRMQRALGFEGSDVGTVFKNLQLDIGAPPQFMDFQFRLDGPDYGEFWLPHCGALLDVEPFGEERVRGMCHHIEDPTFDATAAATHPRMKMRPIHRPPRKPAGRYPACRWAVFIDDEGTDYEHHPNLGILERSLLATLEVRLPDRDAEPGGWPDYAGPFDPGFQLEDLGHRALLAVTQEAAVQSHLLARALMLSAEQRLGREIAADLGVRQWTGIAALTAERLHAALGIPDDGIEAIAKVFQLHPAFQPRDYVDLRVDVVGPGRARLEIHDCPALAEEDALGWLAGLSSDGHPALDAIAGAVNPRARCEPSVGVGGARFAWDVAIDPSGDPRPEPRELALARLSRGASFVFEQRRRLRGVE